jgi:hypothetical protein
MTGLGALAVACAPLLAACAGDVPYANPTGPVTGNAVGMRGGSFGNGGYPLHHRMTWSVPYHSIGFRCAY